MRSSHLPGGNFLGLIEDFKIDIINMVATARPTINSGDIFYGLFFKIFEFVLQSMLYFQLSSTMSIYRRCYRLTSCNKNKFNLEKLSGVRIQGSMSNFTRKHQTCNNHNVIGRNALIETKICYK